MATGALPPIIYNLFPRLAGPFPRWRAHLERASDLGFNWVFLNPVQECGYSGSLYAIKDHFRIDPRYLDPSSRLPAEDQFRMLIEQAHRLGLKVMLDLVLNHTAFDSVLVASHPDWFLRNEHGELLPPRAPDTGEVWGDLAAIDHLNPGIRAPLWRYWEDLVRYYLFLGVDGFRCDAAYQVPIPLWQHLFEASRKVNPAVKFFAETLGCDFRFCLDLSRSGFDYNFNSLKWWNYRDGWALEQYEMNRLQGSPSISFADTHDTPRLAADLEGHVPGLMQRYLLAGLYSTGVMMVAGYEFGFRKRLHVVETGPEDWEPVRIDLTGFVRAVNELKSRHRVFHEESRIQTVDASNPRIFAMLKTSSDDAQRALVAINTDLDGSQRVKIEDLHRRLGYPRQFRDISPEGARNEVPDFYEDRLAPARCVVFCGER